jgi:hypothetical protein
MHPMFEMYHRAFGRPPKPFELTTEKAVARVRNYYDKGILECVDEPAPTNPTDQRVSLPSKSVSVKSQPLSHQTSSSTDLTSTTRLQTEAMLPVPVAQAASSRYVPIPKNELFLLAEQQIQRIMRRQKMTREDVYKTLVIPGDVYLPPAFLKQDPAYARALSDQ